MIRPIVALLSAAVVAAPLSAQVGVRASTSEQAEPSNEEIVVIGEKKKIAQALKNLIEPSGKEQYARFEDRICPIVIGMPRDWTGPLLKMVRENIEKAGAKLEEPGCKPTALAIFIDQPRELVSAMHKEMPDFFGMTPREYDTFLAGSAPVWSWHVVDTRDRDGTQLAQGSIDGNDFGVVKNASATRLYSNVREDMLAGFVVVDRQQTVGKTLRQLADLVTMHLMLDVRAGAGARDRSSILSLFESRAESELPPPSMSNFDRGALAGFYGQRENNRSARQQRINIAQAIKDGAGQEDTDQSNKGDDK